jgi:hypothetical protein
MTKVYPMSNADERLSCAGCGRKIIPRLWHYGGGRLTYIRTQHMCPFCGIVLHETGGGVRWGCLIALLLIASPFIVLSALAVLREIARMLSR